jgi:hypothetical protein
MDIKTSTGIFCAVAGTASVLFGILRPSLPSQKRWPLVYLGLTFFVYGALEYFGMIHLESPMVSGQWICLAGGVAFLSLAYLERRRRPGRRVWMLALIVGISFVLLGVFAWSDQGRTTQTRTIDREIKAAGEASRSRPPGIGQFEELLARLRRIRTEHAPDAVKEALAGYISALQAAIDAAKAGEDLAKHDRALEQGQKRLAAAINDNWN